MSGHHEARINDALKQLGEEYRLGMVQLAEYRSRRRMLLESWGERDVTTSPGSLRSKTATLPNPSLPAATAEAGGRRSLMPFLVVAVLTVLCTVGYFVFRPAAPVPAAPAAPPPDPEVVAVGRAADRFLAASAWDAAAIEQFLQEWRRLGSAERAEAAALPSLVTLRHKLDQNIQAEALLVAPDAPPEQRQRLALLERFARELSGEAP